MIHQSTFFEKCALAALAIISMDRKTRKSWLNQTQPDIIRCNLTQPDTIRHNQTQSDATRRNQTQSDTTRHRRHNKTQPVTTRHNKTHSDTTRRNWTQPDKFSWVIVRFWMSISFELSEPSERKQNVCYSTFAPPLFWWPFIHSKYDDRQCRAKLQTTPPGIARQSRKVKWNYWAIHLMRWRGSRGKCKDNHIKA